MLRIFRISGVLVVLLVMLFDCASARPRKVHVNQFNANGQPAVVMIDGSLDPQILKVRRGTTVEWINNGDGRTVAASDDSFKSEILKPGANFQHTFNRRGTFVYRCHSHQGKPDDMLGTIVVTR